MENKEHYNKGDEVYFTAFLKKNKNRFYACQGEVLEIAGGNPPSFKVRVKSVASKAFCSKGETTIQKALLGSVITKKKNEIYLNLATFMEPEEWLS